MRFLFTSLFCIFLVHPFLSAQERQIALDDSQSLLVIDQKLEHKLNLFPEYEDFFQARMYQLPGEGYVLEITLKNKNQESRERILMDKPEMQAFRESVSQKLRLRAPDAVLDQSGRLELLLNSSAVGLGYYGWATPSVLDVQGGRGFTGLYMLTAGTAIAAPFLLTREKEITKGQANLYGYGATRGIFHGMLLANILQNPDLSSGSDWDKYIDRTFGLGILMSVGEGIAGYHIAKRYQWDRGTTATIGTYGDAGLGAASLFALTVAPDDANPRLLYASALAGSAGGLFLGNKIAQKQSYSSGDAIVLKTSGALGALMPIMFLAAAEADDYRVYTGSALAGGLLGLTAGHYLTKKVDFNAGQGIMVTLGTAAGAGIGAGTGYLVADDSRATLVMGALGAAGGFLSTQSLMAKRAAIARNPGVSFNLQLAPEGLASLSGKVTPQVGAANPFGLDQPAPPIVRASVRF
ncbi:MAG: hypothetical protein AAF399_04270 [Bacteroidota bacterium]